MWLWKHVVTNDLQNFCLKHAKQYGSNIKTLLKETKRDCTSQNGLSNMDREAHERWFIFIDKLGKAYDNISRENIVEMFNNYNHLLGGIKLHKGHLSLLNNKDAALPSHSGLFAPMIVKFCNEKIPILEKKIERRQRSQRKH